MTLLHRRADLRETMSDYLVRELERYGVAVRDRSEIAELHGDGRAARGGHARRAASGCRSRSCSSSSARCPCTEWLGDAVARDDDGFILTGAAAGADSLLETSVPGVFAAGDVRSGSTKRCATAVGEGAMAVQFVHARLRELTGQPAGALSLGDSAQRLDRRDEVVGAGQRLRVPRQRVAVRRRRAGHALEHLRERALRRR